MFVTRFGLTPRGRFGAGDHLIGERLGVWPAGGSRYQPQPTRRAFAPHCWVLNPAGAPGRWPGLLLEWRRANGEWEGRVAHVAHLQTGHALMKLCCQPEAVS